MLRHRPLTQMPLAQIEASSMAPMTQSPLDLACRMTPGCYDILALFLLSSSENGNQEGEESGAILTKAGR